MIVLILSVMALVVIADVAAHILWRGFTRPQSQLLGPALVCGPVNGLQVALTFDDGPNPPFTEEVLTILRNYRVPATFFVCGRNAERFPETLRQIQADGHSIGNHTYTHPYLFLLSRRRIEEEIARTQQAVQTVTAAYPKVFRPPYGIRWIGLYPVLRRHGLRLIAWSNAATNEDGSAEAIVGDILKNLSPGCIIVLHDGRQCGEYLGEALRRRIRRACGLRAEVRQLPNPPVDTRKVVNALPAIIEGARRAGFDFVPLEEFL